MATGMHVVFWFSRRKNVSASKVSLFARSIFASYLMTKKNILPSFTVFRLAMADQKKASSLPQSGILNVVRNARNGWR